MNSNLIIEKFLRNFFEEIISLCPNRKSGSEKLENKREKTPLCTQTRKQAQQALENKSEKSLLCTQTRNNQEIRLRSVWVQEQENAALYLIDRTRVKIETTDGGTNAKNPRSVPKPPNIQATTLC